MRLSRRSRPPGLLAAGSQIACHKDDKHPAEPMVEKLQRHTRTQDVEPMHVQQQCITTRLARATDVSTKF
eukprot:7688383-Pyramimonas_sp.AAC.1